MLTKLKNRNHVSIPVSGLSIYDLIHLGVDEYGNRVDIELMYRNILFGGEPGSGKSSALQNVVGHASMCSDAQLWLFDGKQVELGLWRSVADVFVGPDITDAIRRLEQLQSEMDRRYDELDRVRRRKITQDDPVDVVMAVIDEIALFSATIGSEEDQKKFVRLLRDLVARGRAAGVIVVAATQRPSADIVPTSLRDIFAYRCAFRCTTEASSDTILGRGWAQQGYSATAIAPENQGVGLLLAEGGLPRRMKYSYFSDPQLYELVDFAQNIRSTRAA